MHRFALLLLPALAACQGLSTDASGSGSVSDGTANNTVTNSDAVNGLKKVSSTAQRVAQDGAAAGNGRVAADAATVAETADALASDLAGKSASKTAGVDPSKRLEYADVYTTLGDPTGMKELVPYLLKPEVWTLVKCDMVSDTCKHYRFQKISTGDSRLIPEVDIFKSRR